MNVARICKAAVDRVAVGVAGNVLHAVRRLFADAPKVYSGQGGTEVDSFTFTLPCCCIVIDFLKLPTRRTNYPNLFCYKTPHVSGISSAHRQEFSTVHSALVSFMQVFDDRFHSDSALKRSSRTCMKLTSAECTVENS
jgi:hypothetical protein